MCKNIKKNLSKSVDKVIVVCYSIIMCVIILLYYNQLLDKDKKMVWKGGGLDEKSVLAHSKFGLSAFLFVYCNKTIKTGGRIWENIK